VVQAQSSELRATNQRRCGTMRDGQNDRTGYQPEQHFVVFVFGFLGA